MIEERILIPRIGGPEVLTVEPFAPTPPGPGEVAIHVKAIGLNLADVFCRLGLYAAAPPRPYVPGLEVAGVVAEVGDGVADFAAGDRVAAATFFGAYTTRLNVSTDWVRRLPEAWSFADGAAFPVAYLTAYHGLVNVGQLAEGETVVVQSAAGGVGLAASQIARARGARVIGTVGSEAKQAIAREAGAQEVVVSRDYKVWGAIDRLTEGKGVDVIFDAVGGPGLGKGFKALRPGGRLISYGFAEMLPRGGRRNWPVLAWRFLRTPRFNPMDMTQTNRTVAGFNLIHLRERADLYDHAVKDMMTMVERGAIKPWVGKTFPFHQVADAHAYLQSRQSTGKVILVT